MKNKFLNYSFSDFEKLHSEQNSKTSLTASITFDKNSIESTSSYNFLRESECLFENIHS